MPFFIPSQVYPSDSGASSPAGRRWERALARAHGANAGDRPAGGVLRTPALERVYAREHFGDPGRPLERDEIARVAREPGDPPAAARGARVAGTQPRLSLRVPSPPTPAVAGSPMDSPPTPAVTGVPMDSPPTPAVDRGRSPDSECRVDSGELEVRSSDGACGSARWVRVGAAVYLHDLEVDAHARGRGHGRALVARAATELGARELWVVPAAEAVGFYRRLGFREVGRLETWVAR